MKTKKTATTVTIEMGQAFRDELPKVVKELGGRVWGTGLDGSSTLVRCRATFYGMTPRQIQDKLWERWPSCSIGVTK
jgi:hypothetical protein